MKFSLTTLTLALSLAVSGQAAASGYSCHSVYHGDRVYQQCSLTNNTLWVGAKEVIHHTADPVFSKDSYGNVLSSIEQSGSASKQKSAYTSMNGYGSSVTKTILHVVVESDFDNN